MRNEKVPEPPQNSVNPAVETLATLPGVMIQGQAKDGKWIETIWNSDHTQLVRYVYSGDKKDLLAQTYGEMQNGKWVETTTAIGSKDFITRTETFDKVDGTILSRETTRKAFDGREVTFHGEMKGGRWVETAKDYLSFRSVTVEFDQPFGHAVKRYGILKDGRYAIDTFDGSGQKVVQRDIYDREGGTRKETWKGSDTELTITRYNPSDNIREEEYHYGMVEQDSGPQFVLNGYRASFNKPVKYTFTTGSRRGEDVDKEVDITEYHWRYYTNKIREGERGSYTYSYQDNYREGSTSANYNANGGASFASNIDLGGRLWNKV
jgi:hypothetical protein